MARRGRIDDLTGKRFGKLVVIERAEKPKVKHPGAYWLCRCDCGNEVIKRADSLKKGAKSCGCITKERMANIGKSRFKNISGMRYGRLTVITLHGKDKGGKNLWLCRCDCGNEILADSGRLTSGNTMSCGCFRKEKSCYNHKQHGLSNSKIYKAWSSMRSRCNCKTNKVYYRYGGRGIKVCKEWDDNFQAFYDWSISNGFRDDLTIDRIDNNGDYSPDNCRWATMLIQDNNKRNNVFIAHNGETHTAAEWDRLLGNCDGTVADRLRRGWSVEDAISVPKHHKRECMRKEKNV